ncbi:MAG: hypothetical protein M1820_006634 [Bogoriella megaspora]|nr:MAG: hypothetical protein M1820_006634 [Bogoriella megaspora]
MGISFRGHDVPSSSSPKRAWQSLRASLRETSPSSITSYTPSIFSILPHSTHSSDTPPPSTPARDPHVSSEKHAEHAALPAPPKIGSTGVLPATETGYSVTVTSESQAPNNTGKLRRFCRNAAKKTAAKAAKKAKKLKQGIKGRIRHAREDAYALATRSYARPLGNPQDSVAIPYPVRSSGGANNKIPYDLQPDPKPVVEPNSHPADNATNLEESLKKLAIELRAEAEADSPDELASLTVQVLKTTGGNNNRVYILEYSDGLKICVRVPYCGKPDEWFLSDAQSLRSCALTMKYIWENTAIPMPAVIAYDTTMDNAIKAPYLILSYVEGRTADEIWWRTDLPVPLETRRHNLLKSLAAANAQLRHCQFPWMGSLDFQDTDSGSPVAGPIFNGNFGDRRDATTLAKGMDYRYPPAKFLSNALIARLNTWSKSMIEMAHEKKDDIKCTKIVGSADLYALIIGCLPHCKDSYETFYLAHPDMDFLNILADDDGHITAILDWDRVDTLPGYLGWACQPHFLMMDWAGGYVWPPKDEQEMHPSEIEHYRIWYARYLRKEADFEGDSIYTGKTHMMYSIFSRMASSGHEEVLFNLLDLIVPRLNHLDYLDDIVKDGLTPVKETFLRHQFSQLFEPDRSGTFSEGTTWRIDPEQQELVEFDLLELNEAALWQ